MSSISSGGTGPTESGARVPSDERIKGLLAWLDGWLSEELRRAPLAELGRARVVAGTAVALIVIAVLADVIFLVGKEPWSYVVGGSITLVGYVATLWGLRRATSPRRPALLLSGIMAVGALMLCYYQNDLIFSANATMMMITLLAEYLLGPLQGLVILIPMTVSVGVGLPLWHRAFGAELRAPTLGEAWGLHALAAVCLVSGWLVGWLYSSAQEATHTALERDIQARKEAETKLGELHRTLLDVSRQAGMTEIATGVLHNVGNTLNSVNISVGVVTEQLRRSRVPKLVQATRLMREHSADLGAWLASDSRGAKLPDYLEAVAEQLAAERDALLTEMQALNESVEHIKSIVSMQQQHARYGGVLEMVRVPQLIDDALRLSAGAFERHGIEVECDYTEVPAIMVDRHKLLQILLNLLSNARHALAESETEDKRLTIRVGLGAGGEQLRIEVADNGVGIAAENLTRVFAQGFTTKKTGHGFGLHISALAAVELKGRLSVASPGRGQGATFTIELPVHTGEATPAPAPAG